MVGIGAMFALVIGLVAGGVFGVWIGVALAPGISFSSARREWKRASQGADEILLDELLASAASDTSHRRSEATTRRKSPR